MRSKLLSVACTFLVTFCSLAPTSTAQDIVTVLTGAELTRIVPAGFYFQGLSAQTQMRNSAAARLGNNRYVISALVDTSGYSSDIREKYAGFLITDSPITVGGKSVEVGAYGFGFIGDGKFNLLDLSGKELLVVAAHKDEQLARPRPLTMMKAGNGIRLYSGRDYVEIAAR